LDRGSFAFPAWHSGSGKCTRPRRQHPRVDVAPARSRVNCPFAGAPGTWPAPRTDGG